MHQMKLQVTPSPKEAEQSAAHTFQTDPEVMKQGRNMPKGRKRLEHDEFKQRIKRQRRLARETARWHGP